MNVNQKHTFSLSSFEDVAEISLHTFFLIDFIEDGATFLRDLLDCGVFLSSMGDKPPPLIIDSSIGSNTPKGTKQKNK